MKRKDAIVQLIGQLSGLDPDDEHFEEKVERLVTLEMNFPGTAENICRMVRGKIFQKYPIDEDMIARAAQLCAVDKLHASGLSDLYTPELVQMEVESEHRSWGRIRTFAPHCKESQHKFARFLRTGKSSDMKKVITACRYNR